MKREHQGKSRIAIKGIMALLLLLVFTMAIPSTVEAAKINKKTLTLVKGKTYTLKVTGTQKKVTWKTSKKSVVQLGTKKKYSIQIKAIKPGKVIITGKVNGKTYICSVNIVNPVINKAELALKIGEIESLNVKGGTGKITWKSSKPDYATVTNTGKVIARKAGMVKITAEQNGKKLTCTLTINLREKKVWVVTKEAYTIYRPVYTNVRSELECTCGYKTEDSEAFNEHTDNHLLNLEPSAYRINTLKDLLYIEEIYYPEEGYWETVYY